MGQKVNPISLRLHPENKHFDCCWFSEKQYAHSIHKNLNVEAYYNAILKQIKYPSASFFLEAAPRKCRVSALFLNPTWSRQQYFKEPRNLRRGSGGARGGTLFSTKKKTTRSCGLGGKRGGCFETSPPLPFTPSFLQNLKNKDSLLAPLAPGNKSKTAIKGALPGLGNEKESKKRNQDLVRSSFLHAEKGDLQRVRAPFFFSQQAAQGEGGMGQPLTLVRRGMWSSVVILAIWRYLIERGGGQNLLSSTSRFLLLQAFFSFLKVGEKNHLSNGAAPFSRGQNNAPSPAPARSGAPGRICFSPCEKHQEQTPDLQDSRDFFTSQKPARSANRAGRQYLFSKIRKSRVYAHHIESLISKRFRSCCKISLFRAQDVAQNATFVAEEVVYQLQRRNTFRQIKTKFLQELGYKRAIKGIRVTCVGRIGARAKKAQRAREESFKMGQTSLHLFDSKLSFASKTALTPFGAVGVKVWICWK